MKKRTIHHRKSGMLNNMVAKIVLYNLELWVLNNEEIKRVKVLKEDYRSESNG